MLYFSMLVLFCIIRYKNIYLSSYLSSLFRVSILSLLLYLRQNRLYGVLLSALNLYSELSNVRHI